jgi:hypothetical protein
MILIAWLIFTSYGLYFASNTKVSLVDGLNECFTANIKEKDQLIMGMLKTKTLKSQST